MAPRAPGDISEDESTSAIESGDDPESVSSERAQLPNQLPLDDALEPMKENYHTEGSDASTSEDERDQDVAGNGEVVAASESAAPGPPLLPAELLKPLPSPANSPRNAVFPRDQTTQGQKTTNTKRSRRAKQQAFDWLREETKGTGVLEAGRVAQLKRGVVPARDRVRKGRIEKKTEVQVSGRQRLLEQRKKLDEQKGKQFLGPSKKAKTKKTKS